MSGCIFWDVDTQIDFMLPDGKLYVPGAENLRPVLGGLTSLAHAHGIRIVASADDHMPDHAEISESPDYETTFPPHCMRGTRGQQKIEETALVDPLIMEPDPVPVSELRDMVGRHHGDILFHKHEFDVFSNPNVEPVLDVLKPDCIVVYGVAMDVCNRFAIEGFLSRAPGIKVYAVTDATKPIDAGKADALLAEWKNRGVKLITSNGVEERIDWFAGRYPVSRP